MTSRPPRSTIQLCVLFSVLFGSFHALEIAASAEVKSPHAFQRMPRSRFRAVTVLHQPCSTLGYTLANFASNLGPEWPLLVLHNEIVSSSLKRNKIVQLQEKHGILHTATLESNGFPTLSSSNSSSYSELLASTRFWTSMRAEHVLLFQMDSVLCSMSPWTVEDFLRYDYIGAPWIDKWYGMEIGNGGLSLRKTKTMIRITKTFRFRETENEDIFFSRGIYKLARLDPSIEIPPVHVAAKFAYEAGKLPRVTSFGVHKTPLMKVDEATIAKTCPEARASVWRGCQVDTYDETTPGAMLQVMDRRFLAVDRGLDVLDFEKDFDITEKIKVAGAPRKLQHLPLQTEQRHPKKRVHVNVVRLVLLLLLLLILFAVRVPRKGARHCRISGLCFDCGFALLENSRWHLRFLSGKEHRRTDTATSSTSRQRRE